MLKNPVFVFGHRQVGSSTYKAMACFLNMGVRVPFSLCSLPGEDDPRESVWVVHEAGKAASCDGSCIHAEGTLHDFEKATDFEEVTKKARAFYEAHE